MTPKRHLIRRTFPLVAACGLKRPTLWTRKLGEVTCDRCVRTEYMALAELRAANRKPKKLRKRERSNV